MECDWVLLLSVRHVSQGAAVKGWGLTGVSLRRSFPSRPPTAGWWPLFLPPVLPPSWPYPPEFEQRVWLSVNARYVRREPSR